MGAAIRRLVRWVTTTFATLFERLAAVGFIQSGVVLAAQTFLALLPLLIVVVAFFPESLSGAVADTVRHRVGITGASADTLSRMIASRDSLHGGISIFGVVVALASATAFTRALQRVYEVSWDLPRLGLRGSLQGLAWLVGLVAYVTMISLAVRFAGSGWVGSVVRPVLLGLGSVVLWWLTPFVLLLGRVRLRALLPSGVLTGLVMVVLGAVAMVVVPHTVENNERRFGTIGAVFAIESWLVIIGCAIVAAAVVGAVLAQLAGPIGRLARGSADPDAWHRTPARRPRRPRRAAMSSSRVDP